MVHCSTRYNFFFLTENNSGILHIQLMSHNRIVELQKETKAKKKYSKKKYKSLHPKITQVLVYRHHMRGT